MSETGQYRKSAASLDDFVGGGEQRRRDGEAEGFGGLEVDDQFETRRLLDRQIAGSCTFQDLVDVADRAAEIIEEIRSIREKHAVGETCSAFPEIVGTLCAMADALTCTRSLYIGGPITHAPSKPSRAMDENACSMSSGVVTSNICIERP